jgi:putative SbcD/Mre11-related phosphoesterase
MLVLKDWLLTAQRAAIHVPTATAVVADLHLGYDAVRCRAGEAIPAFGLDEVVALFTALLHEHAVRCLVIAGDCFEDARDDRSADQLRRWLAQERIEVVGVVPGNHDRGLCSDAAWPLLPQGVELGDWRVVHGDCVVTADRIVQGHIHPCLRWQGHTAPCFLVGRDHLVLPAFSADASGVNILRGSHWRAYLCCLIAGEQVLDFGLIGNLQRKQKVKGKRQK